MDTAEIAAAAAVERRSFADLLESLDDEQLATPSLCGQWTVRDVAGHLASAVSPSKRPFLLAMARNLGNFDRANDAVAREFARRPVAEIAAVLREHAESRFAPPVVGIRGPMTDSLVHAGDVTVPLGLPHDPALPTVRVALDFVTTGRPIGFVSRGRLSGLRLVADDVDWSWGAGAEVRGRGMDVLMAACGRAALLDSLTGPGVDVLRSRLR